MAHIKFASEEAWRRYLECKDMSRDLGANSLSCRISQLINWGPWDSTIYISTDYDELSFYFWQEYADGSHGLNGGIIFHGKRDGFGSGQGPTFSVCLEPTDGYSIHT